MKNQALFSSTDKSKNLKCCLLQFLFGAFRVKKSEKLSQNYPQNLTLPRGYKTFFMLNSTEHEIFPAHKC